VSLAIDVSPAQPVVGELVTVRITATNNGPSDAVGVTVFSQAPEGATDASGSATKGSCTGTASLVCTLGTLSATHALGGRAFAAGESAEVVHRFRLPNAGPATTQVTANASSNDPNPADNARDLLIAVQGGDDPPDDGKPNANETVVVQPLTGRVLVKLPDSDRYVELSSLALEEVPNGTLVDARNGRFVLTAAAADGGTASSQFADGIVAVSQVAATQVDEPGTTELRLTGGDFGRPCTTALAKAKAKKPKRKAKRRTFAVEQQKPVKPVRRLWGNGKGNFRTTGRYGSATVRGTVWLTEDYCNGTLIRVREGAVTVRDLVKKRTVVVTAGRSYFAEAPAPKKAKKRSR
jgi:uncharacterized repeat protein (TIGR01451 family)